MVERYYRRPAIEELTGLSRSTIYNLMQKGDFPKPVKLTGKAVGWSESAISDWLASRR
ncbi:helix-turn-helix transcriptional regulator [Paracoccus zeaxanthinifaciens]|uniref:helix-turn-helix transcriptional regulator n=1 Tax=Paracoccus zeaxanthinifaciens TaxID=187400 RepID=UPI0004914581|nr:AlpA family transcriptional regulator [Paracoccus zeaxanthinifaciens]